MVPVNEIRTWLIDNMMRNKCRLAFFLQENRHAGGIGLANGLYGHEHNTNSGSIMEARP